jgi:hypothetical protein
MNPTLDQAIRRLIDDLVAGAYDAIEADGRGGRLTADEMRFAIAGYGRELISLPADKALKVEVYPLDEDPRLSAIDVELWTREEGRSDLTLQLSVDESGDDIKISIDDLHVL